MEMRLGMGMGTGELIRRCTLSLSQGCNPISSETIGLEAERTVKSRWTWELCDGVWLPKTWNETVQQKGGRDEERQVTFVENRVNREVEADAFSFSRLGLRRGDNVRDRRTQEKYQYQGD